MAYTFHAIGGYQITDENKCCFAVLQIRKQIKGPVSQTRKLVSALIWRWDRYNSLDLFRVSRAYVKRAVTLELFPVVGSSFSAVQNK